MRRSIAAAVTLLTLAFVPTPVVAQQVAAGAGQGAFADWLFLRGNRGRSYFVEAFREAETGTSSGAPEPGAFVIVAKGTCTVERGRHVTVIICIGRGFARRLPFNALEIDPLLSSAHVEVHAGGFRHTVDWTGRGNGPQPGGGILFGPGQAEAGIGATRGARASGRLFGDRVPAGGGPFSFAALGEGAGGFVDAVGAPGPGEPGAFRFTRTIRLAA